ncbi:MAG: DUF4863 family protein [Planctomycetota bacterium]
MKPSDLAALLSFASRLDLSRAPAAREALQEAFPFEGDFVRSVAGLLRRGVAEGTLCDRGRAPLQYSRIFPAGPESSGLSADAVLMSVPGPRHRHPNGEIDLFFAEEGNPRFDGQAPGWVVYPPDSVHVPTVEGGTMLILYLLPGGAIEFLGPG